MKLRPFTLPLLTTGLAAIILWAPLPGMTEATASPASPLLCDFNCRCIPELGNEDEEDTVPACYEETTMVVLNSTNGCCSGTVSCGQAQNCSWTVEITVTNTDDEECCYQLLKNTTAIHEDSCSSGFQKQDSASAACDAGVLYKVRAEGAVCPHDPEALCLTPPGSAEAWYQRVNCVSYGANCPEP